MKPINNQMERVSLPGVYQGYSDLVANGYRKWAQYVPVRDGCRLAVDIYRPTFNGATFEKPLPTIIVSSGYRRSFLLKPNERLRDMFFPRHEYGDCVGLLTQAARLINRHEAHWLEPVEGMSKEEFRTWLKARGSTYEFVMMHGYNYVVFDNRATGASFGKSNGLDHQTHGMDISNICEWTAQQQWSTAELGMMGASWLGLAQNAAISCHARHLKAVMPCVAGEDTFTPMYPGGLYNVGLMRQWYTIRDLNERGYEADAVDEDVDGTLLRAAIAERQELSDDPHWVLTIPTADEREALLDKYAQWSRDRYGQNGRYYDRDLPDGTHGDWNMSHLDPAMANQTEIAYYGYGGFFDLCSYTVAMAQADLTVPRKMVIGPWHHVNWGKTETEEALRWVDYHLKGIQNGIMDEPSVVYSVSHPDKPVKWYGADQFPPSGMSWLTLHGTPDNAGGELRGVLAEQPASRGSKALRFTVDYETTTGLENRHWGYFIGPQLSMEKLERFRDRILTFLTEPLAKGLEITGYPVLRFSMTTSGTEGGVFAYLHDVGPDGQAYPLSEGQLNLRDRKVSEPPFNYLGLPYHSILERDRLPVTPGKVMRIEFALCPVSWFVPAGHRLCLTIAGADKDNSYLRVQDPRPQIEVFCDNEWPLTLDLPVMPEGPNRGAVLIEGAFQNIADTSRGAFTPTRIGDPVYTSLFGK